MKRILESCPTPNTKPKVPVNIRSQLLRHWVTVRVQLTKLPGNVPMATWQLRGWRITPRRQAFSGLSHAQIAGQEETDRFWRSATVRPAACYLFSFGDGSQGARRALAIGCDNNTTKLPNCWRHGVVINSDQGQEFSAASANSPSRWRRCYCETWQI